MAELSPIELLNLQADFTDQQKMMFTSQYNSDKKDRTTALILSVFGGFLGVDRFYVGDVGLGIGKLLTMGGCGLWSIIDWFKIRDRVDEINRAKAREIAMAIKLT